MHTIPILKCIVPIFKLLNTTVQHYKKYKWIRLCERNQLKTHNPMAFEGKINIFDVLVYQI